MKRATITVQHELLGPLRVECCWQPADRGCGEQGGWYIKTVTYTSERPAVIVDNERALTVRAGDDVTEMAKGITSDDEQDAWIEEAARG